MWHVFIKYYLLSTSQWDFCTDLWCCEVSKDRVQIIVLFLAALWGLSGGSFPATCASKQQHFKIKLPHKLILSWSPNGLILMPFQPSVQYFETWLDMIFPPGPEAQWSCTCSAKWKGTCTFLWLGRLAIIIRRCIWGHHHHTEGQLFSHHHFLPPAPSAVQLYVWALFVVVLGTTLWQFITIKIFTMESIPGLAWESEEKTPRILLK